MLWALLYFRIYQNCESFIETWLMIIIKHRQWGINLFTDARNLLEAIIPDVYIWKRQGSVRVKQG